MTLSARGFGMTMLVGAAAFLAGCGDFATRNICFLNADPGCQPDQTSPTVPGQIQGPNPNYPDPNVWKSAPGRARLDAAPSKVALRINELLLSAREGAEGGQALELLNDTGEEFDASGYTIRFDGGEWTFPEGTVIGGGEFVVIRFSNDGSGDAQFFADLPTINADAGGLALISPKGEVCDYVQWGEAGSEFEAYATGERQWLEGAKCRPPVAGASLSFVGGGNLPTDFTALWPTLGAPNK